MPLKSFLFLGKAIPAYDEEIVMALKLTVAELSLVHEEWMQLGIRNEVGDLYRVVGVTGDIEWVQALVTMRLLGYVDELAGCLRPKEGCDVIFSRPY
ncbi:hypothetical protein PO002_44010 [Cupriavidus necator]|uniref:hypothetical protein n=1 Tax=Cupriavidus necator TaxID=106590 RepID=UPI0039C17623